MGKLFGFLNREHGNICRLSYRNHNHYEPKAKTGVFDYKIKTNLISRTKIQVDIYINGNIPLTTWTAGNVLFHQKIFRNMIIITPNHWRQCVLGTSAILIEVVSTPNVDLKKSWPLCFYRCASRRPGVSAKAHLGNVMTESLCRMHIVLDPYACV